MDGARHATWQQAENKWGSVLRLVLESLDPHTYDTWFASTRPAAYNDKTRELFVSCPTPTHRAVLSTNHQQTLSACASRAGVADIQFLVRPGDFDV